MPTGKNQTFNVTLLGFLLAMTLFARNPELHGACAAAPWTNFLTCHFHHANLFHWGCNALALWLMRPSPYAMLVALVYGSFAMLAATQPTIGISAAIYAYIGMNIFRWNMRKSDWATFISANILTYFMPGVAFGVHLAAFVLGVGHACIEYQLNRIKTILLDER